MLLCVFITVTLLSAKANDSCKILFNKQVIFKGSVEEGAADAFIKVKRLTAKDCITIRYYSENTSKGWQRTFYINGPEESNLKTITIGKQSGAVSVKASVLNEMKEKKLPVFIYTTSLPTDKAMAARVRVRRMLICKIEWN